MPLYVKDAEVDRLAERLAKRRNVTKTEAVRQALRQELARDEVNPGLVEAGLDFVRALHARGRNTAGRPADKAFTDSLYGDD